MTRRIISLLSLTLLVSTILFLVHPPTPVAAYNPFQKACGGGGGGSFVCSTNGKDPVTGKEQEGVLIKATRLLAIVVGVAAVIMIIVAGLQYILSSGDPSRTAQAKNTIIYALVGLVIAAFAPWIIGFIVSKI